MATGLGWCGLHGSVDQYGKSQKCCYFSNTSKIFWKMPKGTEEPERPLRSPSSNQTERMWGQIISATITLRGAQRERALVSTIQLPSSPANKQTHTALCHPLRLFLLLLMLLRSRQLALNQPNIIPPSSSFPWVTCERGDSSAEQRRWLRFLVHWSGSALLPPVVPARGSV